MSTVTLESACTNLSEYESAVQKVSDLLKSRGYVIFVVALKKRYYIVGGNKFATVSLLENDVLSALQKAGIQEEHVIRQKRLATDPTDPDDENFREYIVVLGKKC